MTLDRELEVWRQQWQADAAVPQGLPAAIEHQTRNMRVLLAVQIAVTFIFGVGSIAWAFVSFQEDATVLTVAMWTFLTIGWTFSLANRRGTWKPATSTTAAFLDLMIVRCRRRLRTMAFAPAFYVAVLSFNLAWTWIYQDSTRHDASGLWTFLTSGPNLVVWIVTAGLGVLAVGYRRRIQTQVKNLVTVRRQLDEPVRTL
ncbi:MAG TPA: hypothetical protein VGY48_01195 [Vicinamibacterales bacterium]|nr:hypothetical protein [Vicinamibacterales bacterium]